MDSKTIKELFGTLDRNFKIPSYQRAYSWEKENVEQFIEDLKEKTDKYYLGNFLFEKDEKNEKDTYYLIDGQQRLTTCVIFFSAIKKFLEEKKIKDEYKILNIEDITAKYLYGISGSQKDEPRFETVAYDNNFFRKEILGLPAKDNAPEFATSSKIRLKEAKKIIESRIKKSETEIENWVKKIEEAKITCYVENDKVHSTQIFSFQNDRGKKLTTLEILKAYFMLQVYLSSSNENDIKEIEISFTSIYFAIEEIKGIPEDTILNYWWRSENEKGFSSSNTIEEIKDKISQIKDTTEKANIIKKYAKDLAKAFETVKKIQARKDEDTRNLLKLDNMSLSYPFLIKVDRITDEAKYLDIYIKILENITLRDIVIMRKSQVDKRLNKYLQTLTIENISEHAFGIINEIQKNGYWGYWNDINVKGAISNGYFYNNPACKYILYRYDLSIGNEQTSKKYDYNELQTEHIAPQTPEDGSAIANGYGKYQGDKAIEDGEWLNSIGNLMIIYGPNNASIGNKDFETKLKSYDKQQRENIESYLENKNKPLWDSKAIEKRHKKMVDAVMGIWDMNKVLDFVNRTLDNK